MLRVLLLRLIAIFRKQRLDRDLDEELQSHLEMLVAENLRRGMPQQEAHRAARLSLGSIENTKEMYRDQRGLPLLETFFQDFRYAVRTLRKSPGFTAVAVLVLALGIGVNSAIFSVVEGVMLRPLPYPEPDRLVSLWEEITREPPANWKTSGATLGGGAGPKRMNVAPANLADYERQNHVFSGIAGVAVVGKNLTESGPAEWIFGEKVNAGYVDGHAKTVHTKPALNASGAQVGGLQLDGQAILAWLITDGGPYQNRAELWGIPDKDANGNWFLKN